MLCKVWSCALGDHHTAATTVAAGVHAHERDHHTCAHALGAHALSANTLCPNALSAHARRVHRLQTSVSWKRRVSPIETRPPDSERARRRKACAPPHLGSATAVRGARSTGGAVPVAPETTFCARMMLDPPPPPLCRSRLPSARPRCVACGAGPMAATGWSCCAWRRPPGAFPRTCVRERPTPCLHWRLAGRGRSGSSRRRSRATRSSSLGRWDFGESQAAPHTACDVRTLRGTQALPRAHPHRISPARRAMSPRIESHAEGPACPSRTTPPRHTVTGQHPGHACVAMVVA